MNCKPGDLAMVVRAINARNLGKIVQVVSFVPALKWRTPNGYRIAGGWRLDAPTQGWDGGWNGLIPDDCLRPIRDPGDDAADETLDWKQVPSKEVA
jgi:hypothetical protein